MSQKSPVRLAVIRPRANLRGGGAQLATSEGITPPNTVFQDPYLYPPEGSRSINLSAPQAIVGANTLYAPAALNFALPPNHVGVIDTIDLQLDGILTTTNVVWRILVTGSPAPGWNITIPGISGAAAAIKSWEKSRIQIPVSGSIGVQIVNIDGGAYTATTTLYGWFWPVKR